jgi:nuclear pore complex protein Nup62
MPIIAVAVAIGADVLAGSAVAATVGGIAAISATTAFEVIAAVGATIGAVGAVTKDKTLSTVGLAIGAVGGIGALATSAGLFGATAASGAPLFGAAPAASTADSAGSAFGGAASDASSAATYGPTSAFATGDAAGATAAATEAGTGLAAPLATANTGSDGMVNFVAGLDQAPPSDGLTTLNSTAENAGNPAALPGPRADGAGLLTDPNAPLLTDPNAPTVPGLTGTGNSAASANVGLSVSDAPGANFSLNGQPPTPGPTDSSVAGFPASGAAAPASANSPLVSDITGAPWKPLTSGDGTLDGILEFANKNPAVTLGALQAGGSFLSGAFSTLTPAQVAAYNAQAAANQAAANLATQQTQNLAAPKAVASLTPVTGAPGPLVPPTANPLAPQVQLPGLMNNVPPPRLAPVTGSVA